jgi:hypothetical protein
MGVGVAAAMGVEVAAARLVSNKELLGGEEV